MTQIREKQVSPSGLWPHKGGWGWLSALCLDTREWWMLAGVVSNTVYWSDTQACFDSAPVTCSPEAHTSTCEYILFSKAVANICHFAVLFLFGFRATSGSAQWLLLVLHSESTPSRLGGLYGTLGIEPMCKTNTLPAVLLLHFFLFHF